MLIHDKFNLIRAEIKNESQVKRLNKKIIRILDYKIKSIDNTKTIAAVTSVPLPVQDQATPLDEEKKAPIQDSSKSPPPIKNWGL